MISRLFHRLPRGEFCKGSLGGVIVRRWGFGLPSHGFGVVVGGLSSLQWNVWMWVID